MRGEAQRDGRPMGWSKLRPLSLFVDQIIQYMQERSQFATPFSIDDIVFSSEDLCDQVVKF